MKKTAVKIALACMVMLMVAQTASADLVFCGKKDQTEVVNGKLDGGCTLVNLFEMVYLLVNFLIGMAGLVALLYIVIGGAQMMLSTGDPTKIGEGKKTIANAIIGFILVMASYLIVSYVADLLMPGLGGNPLEVLKDYVQPNSP
jgi:hypothetical protein